MRGSGQPGPATFTVNRWPGTEAISRPDARWFPAEFARPAIANGGFQHRSVVEAGLSSGGGDLVSVARPRPRPADRRAPEP